MNKSNDVSSETLYFLLLPEIIDMLRRIGIRCLSLVAL